MNFIVIMSDGMRADFVNNPKYTPSLHKFFKEYGGLKFMNAYSTTNWTFAAMLSLHTGLLPSKNGLWDITYAKHAARMERRMESRLLKSNAFKATNCTDDEFLLTKLKKSGYTIKYLGLRSYWAMLLRSVSHLYDTNSFYDINFMQMKVWEQEQFEDPFFLFSHDCDGGHDPWGMMVRDDKIALKGKTFRGDHPTAFAGKYIFAHQKEFPMSRLYQMMGDQIKQYDEKLRILLEWFVKTGLYKNTAFILFSDHGESLWEHSKIIGHAMSLYEEEIHIPLFVYWPNGKNSELKEISDPVSIVDIMPTILGTETIADGVNLFVRRRTRFVFFEFTRYRKERDIEQEWKILPSPVDFIRGVRFGKYKLLYIRSLKGEVAIKLYDLSKSSLESEEAQIENPEVEKLLLDKLVETFNMDIENLQHIGCLEEVIRMESDYLKELAHGK